MRSVMDVRDALKASLVEKMRIRADVLSAGRATDFADYKMSVGRIQGLKDAYDSVDEIFNRLLDERE